VDALVRVRSHTGGWEDVSDVVPQREPDRSAPSPDEDRESKDTVRIDLVRRIRRRFHALVASVFAGEVERLTDVRAAHP